MGLSVIHFSDIHIKGNEDIVLNRVNKIKTACAGALPSNGHVVIAISGDIADSGQKDQYDIAGEFIRTISEYIEEQKSSEVSFVCVPGNHDCDFSQETSIRKTLVNSIVMENIDNTYYSNVVSVQNNYVEFSERFDIDSRQVLPAKEINVGDDKILFILANTSWMSTIKENPGRIVMPCALFGKQYPSDYKVVFYMYHHPINWLNPDYKDEFINHVRQNADIVLTGHEHSRDSYQKIGDNFSAFCNHGKELQQSDGTDSAFSVINFDESYQNYEIIDFKWNEKIYDRINSKTNQFHKNIASLKNVFQPNKNMMEFIEDVGVNINHFAKENIILSDIFVWPEINRVDYHNERAGTKTFRADIATELMNNKLSIIVGASNSGKTSVAKMLFSINAMSGKCAVLFNGQDFTISNPQKICQVIEKNYINQYSEECLEEFRQLPKEEKIAIIDDFDLINIVKERRNIVLDGISDNFSKVIIFVSSNIDITSIVTSNTVNSLPQLFYYDLLPLGNRKRKELISKWYRLAENNICEDNICERIDNSILLIDKFLGNGAAFIPATPVVIISTLQNIDAKQTLFSGSKYSFLYESLIMSSLSKNSADYTKTGSYNIDCNILAKLAFDMLNNKKTSFNMEELNKVVLEFDEEKMINIFPNDFLRRMKEVKIICEDVSGGNVYRFKYPYIFYYFSGRYIAYNLKEANVKQKIEYMSTRLYNETYGNIIIFVCHFANSNEVIDDILLNAYMTLDNYDAFDFTKSNPIFDRIQETVEALIPKKIATNEKVDENKDKVLAQMDEAGINDGHVTQEEEIIEDDISEREKDIASVFAALKTLEVLGQILQNYPGEIDGEYKIAMIGEMHKLGMRSVQALISAMEKIEDSLVEFIAERAVKVEDDFNRSEIISKTKRMINILIAGMVRGMVHQVATSLNSEYILDAATKTFEQDSSISSKLILLDLKLNCINNFNFNEIKSLKESFNASNERFASCILDSIVGQYLNYNQCDYTLRSRLCQLCDFSEQKVLASNKKNILS